MAGQGVREFRPYPYQEYCIGRIMDGPAVGLFLDMGLGKTAVTLMAVWRLKFLRLQAPRVLIVAPKKVAEATWTAELAKWRNLEGLTIARAVGTWAQKEEAFGSDADIVVTNRESVPRLVAEYRGKKWRWDMVVLDESSSFKNPASQRFKALKRVRAQIARLVELTGTPSPNGMMDLWAQVYLLDGGKRLCRTLGAYRASWFVPSRYLGPQVVGWDLRPGAADEIRARIADICVSMKSEDYIQLPEVVYEDVPVALDPAAAKAYDSLERDYVLEAAGEEITAGGAAVLAGKLLQLCNGAAYADGGGWAEVHACKIEALLETLEQTGDEHVLLFYRFRHDVERIVPAVEKRFPGKRVRTYSGPADLEDWNSGKVDLLLAHPASCGYGLNMQEGGRHAVWFGLTWSLEEYQQANKRLHRQGQERPVVIHRLLVEGRMDVTVAKALDRKGRVQDDLLEALKAKIREAGNGKAS